MYVALDADVCCGYGNCSFHAPEVFQLDEDAGVSRVLLADVPADLRDRVAAAAADCPVQAITISEPAS